MFQERLDRCLHCEAPVFEVVFCNQCGETALDALREADREGIERLTPARAALAEDEFLAELVEEAPDAGADDPTSGRQTVDPHRILITALSASKARPIPLARATGAILEVGEPGVRRTLVAEIALLQPSETRLAWADVLQMIQKDETCRRWIRGAIWMEREAAFSDETTFARFLVLRKVNRQPRTANSLETMGLLRLCFRHIEETIATPPEAFARHGGTLADWRDFLTLALTRVFRGNVAVDTDQESLHWIMPDVPKRFIVPPGGNTYGDKKLRAWPHRRS